MRRLTFIFVLIFSANPLFAFQSSESENSKTTLIFVRHAERAEDGTRNPPISEEGISRAENLASEIKKGRYNLTAIYSTPYKRTRMTATPTAEMFELEIIEYGFDNLENWLTGLITSNSGKTILIVCHSNTTPRLINLVLGEEKFEQLDEHAYGDLFVVNTDSFGSGSVEKLKF